MAISTKSMMWVIVILGLISVGSMKVKAQTAAEAPAPGTGSGTSECMNALYNMSDCLTFVEKGSKLSKPDKNCCPEIAGMLDSNPICLCQLLGKSQDFGLELDMKKALKLPSACKLQTPDVSLCSAVGVPLGAPAGGPMSSAGPSSSLPGMSPEAAGEAAGPAAGKNGASIAHLNAADASLFAGLAVAFFTLLKL